MKKFFYSLIALGAVVMATTACNGCTSAQESNEQEATEMVVDSVAVAAEEVLTPEELEARLAAAKEQVVGKYAGTIPCADCPGVKVELQINEDLTVNFKEEWLERDLKGDNTGKLVNFNPETAILTLHLDSTDEPLHLKKVAEGQLLLLNAEKAEPETLRENYILNVVK